MKSSGPGTGNNQGYDWPLQEHHHPRRQQGFCLAERQRQRRQHGAEIHRTNGKFVNELGKRGPLTASVDLSQFGMVGRSRTRREGRWRSMRPTATAITASQR